MHADGTPERHTRDVSEAIGEPSMSTLSPAYDEQRDKEAEPSVVDGGDSEGPSLSISMASNINHGQHAEFLPVAVGSGKRGEQKRRNQDLPDVIEIVIGMKVMVTQNVKTDLDIANGAWGTIVDILLSPDEPTILEIKPITKLQHLPICILVKLTHT
ncbi:hypothetical protein PAXINDRAFT_18577 [Paxillus involutus ATCC 200175]|uniref:Uncharacterized protein n=1 Tax=Paxillus involutus ATCC 200175 TaxID=664439 RepID=A0A0C9TKB0_PAXIN|nr:hypothetical protein PAXINDRAFT_18577 [Paxillus involutus ATCC 200175]